jgi:hypothetical protein
MFRKSEKIVGGVSALALCLTTATYFISISEPLKFSDEISQETHVPEYTPVVVSLKSEVLVPRPFFTTFTEAVITRPIVDVPMPPRRPRMVASHKSTQAVPKSDLPQTPEALAYAPEPGIDLADTVFGVIRRAFTPKTDFTERYGTNTAVYKITDHKVYLPDGTELEAHSGLGQMRDDPHYVHVRMRGPTPPHVYDLSWRESPFHGVHAIRLNPRGGSNAIYNRDGLLAHTYMLDPRGASNGCISFRNYEPFMRAFAMGLINKVAVIP